jgi:hypothetical protein
MLSKAKHPTRKSRPEFYEGSHPHFPRLNEILRFAQDDSYYGVPKIDVILSGAKNLAFLTAMRCFATLNMTGVSPFICPP